MPAAILIVIDGFPEATMPPPEGIESMEVLKDVYWDGLLQNYQLSISGGTDKVSYYFSCNYDVHKGILSKPGVLDIPYKFSPTVGIYNQDGIYTNTDRGLAADNPYSTAIQQKRINLLDTRNFFVELDLIKNLRFKIHFWP